MTPSTLLSTYTELLREEALFRALAACTVLVAPLALDDTAEKQALLETWREQIAASVSRADEAGTDAVANLVLVLLHGLTVTAVTRPDHLPRPEELAVALAALTTGQEPER